MVVEPRLRAKVTFGPLAPGSTMEPKASTLTAVRVASMPAGSVVVESNKVLPGAVQRAVTCAALTCNGAGAGFDSVMLTAPEFVTSSLDNDPATLSLPLRKSGVVSTAIVLSV